jgi:hypothetical protein
MLFSEQLWCHGTGPRPLNVLFDQDVEHMKMSSPSDKKEMAVSLIAKCGKCFCGSKQP